MKLMSRPTRHSIAPEAIKKPPPATVTPNGAVRFIKEAGSVIVKLMSGAVRFISSPAAPTRLMFISFVPVEDVVVMAILELDETVIVPTGLML